MRERLKDRYSETGRPSTDPQLLLRILLIGYLYGISSERKLVEELRMHLAWRWFTGLGLDQEIPHHFYGWFDARPKAADGGLLGSASISAAAGSLLVSTHLSPSAECAMFWVPI